jgi:protein subunit release factor B
MKTKLFTVGGDDLKWEYFRAGGKGGQKQNKTSSACRVTHTPSGIAHEAREERQQIQNRRSALAKLAADPKFLLWCRMQYAANQEGFESVAKKVDAAMADTNLRVDIDDACVPGEVHCDVRGSR